MKNENFQKEEREIRNILLISIPIAIIAAIGLILWFAHHFQNMH
jgi:hypothetical protein